MTMKNFDEAVIAQPDGKTQQLTYDEFYQLPLLNRVKLLSDLRVKFYKGGQPVSPHDAVKR
jgi:hypothetical protein